MNYTPKSMLFENLKCMQLTGLCMFVRSSGRIDFFFYLFGRLLIVDFIKARVAMEDCYANIWQT